MMFLSVHKITIKLHAFQYELPVLALGTIEGNKSSWVDNSKNCKCTEYTEDRQLHFMWLCMFFTLVQIFYATCSTDIVYIRMIAVLAKGRQLQTFSFDAAI